MTQINPFIGSIVQSATVQRTQAADKDRHVQRAQNRAKDSAMAGDQFEHQVESSDALSAIRDEQQQEHPQQNHSDPKPKKPTAPPCGTDATGDDAAPAPHLDVKV